jgi:hypothetical protein
MSRKLRDRQDARILKDARFCLSMGYFKGALERALRLERHPALGPSARLIAWIARAYLGDDYRAEALKMLRDVREAFKKFLGGQGLPEMIWLATISDAKLAAKEIQEIFVVADAQHGVLVTWHPTAILRVAEFALEKLQDPRSAVLLTSIVLGWRSIFASREDVQRLAKLLVALDAPVCLWADWCEVLVQHMHFATQRRFFLRDELQAPGASESWARAEDAASEHVVRSVLTDAPRETWTLLQSLAPHLDKAELGGIIKDRFLPSTIVGGRSAEPLWSEPAALRYRYFWYDMITASEQNMVRNGDWAMFSTPTDDFSMALAQWWRALESVLKRAVVELLSSRFAQQPEWTTCDRANLTPKKQKEETVFLDKLTSPDRAAKMTLYDILLVLKKCESTNEHDAGGSRLRLEAARILKQHSAQIGPLTKGTWLHPSHLTQENIDWFRNRSAHDSQAGLVEAAIGRVLAKRILNGFFHPILEHRGFKATLI